MAQTPHDDFEAQDGLTRRGFLQAGALSTLGLALPALPKESRNAAFVRPSDTNCIFLYLAGGPSQLDTFDMKPDAPSGIRGPYRPIRTTNPELQVAEFLPRIARQADRFSVIRTVHYDAPAIHHTGCRVMQSGRVARAGDADFPHPGCSVSYLQGARNELPAHVLLPHAVCYGVGFGEAGAGQGAGFLGDGYAPCRVYGEPHKAGFGRAFVRAREPQPRWQDLHGAVERMVRALEEHPDPHKVGLGAERAIEPPAHGAMREAVDLTREPEGLRRDYGMNAFGQSCLLARRLVERGVRFVTVNMFDTVFNRVTWDMHGSAPFSTIASYGAEVGPMFDRAYAGLLQDLHRRELLENTLVIALGEFGRSPRINGTGGRDHWTHASCVLMAGGGVQGGRVIGRTDAAGAFPVERPVAPGEVLATVYHCLGISAGATLPGPDGLTVRLLDRGAEPLPELL
jgi:hypothetical protein